MPSTRIKNQVGPPVRGQDFFGRETFVQLVSDKLKVGHVLLAAPRRFGKTSVMYNLMDQPRWDYTIIHADLEHMTEAAEFISHLVIQLAKATDTKLSKLVTSLSYFPKQLWKSFTHSFEEVELLKFRAKLRQEIRSTWQESGEELFRLIAKSERTVIFFLDELPMMIDRMARSSSHREEAKTLLRWLRALRLSPQQSNVRFLIAGSIGISHVLNDLGEVSAINDFEQVRLEPFPPKVAAAFIEELAKTQKLDLSRPCQQKMLELIGTPVPYFIQLLFSEIAKAALQDQEIVTPKRIERIYHEKVLGVDCKTYFDHYYGRIRDYYRPKEERSAKRILRTMAPEGYLKRDACFQLYKKDSDPNSDLEEFNHLMSDLENDFYIHFDSGGNQYEFSCKLLRDWWLRHYGLNCMDGEN